MPKIAYIQKNFKKESLDLIEKVNKVIREYYEKGYSLTLRQAYYQLVARGFIENNEKSYKKVGNLINDARLAGLIDWKSIEDRTRNLKRLAHWSTPKEIIDSAAFSYRQDLWGTQDYHVEVWVEKEALSNIVGDASDKLDVSYFCCRGYVSQSEMWSAAQRLKAYENEGKTCVIVYLGDHDPSGIDMSRDIKERLQLFGVNDLVYERVALNMVQVETYNPPPNPAKVTDSRYKAYIDKYGEESWELDALEPEVISELITKEVWKYVDVDRMSRIKDQVSREKAVMYEIANSWSEIYERYAK